MRQTLSVWIEIEPVVGRTIPETRFRSVLFAGVDP
jgi:hypothetical protein